VRSGFQKVKRVIKKAERNKTEKKSVSKIRAVKSFLQILSSA